MTARFIIGIILFCGILYSNVLAEQPFGPSFEKQRFTILRVGNRALLGAELDGAIYGPDDNMESLEKALEGVPEEKRLSIPEYLIVRQYKMILAGNLEGIIADYKTDADKQVARKSYRNIAYSQKYFRENTRGIAFQSKSRFGPWLRIKCKRLNKDPKGFSMPWSVYLQRFGDRYYFVKGPEDGSIFHPVVSAWPYWKPRAARGGKLLAGLDSMTILPAEVDSTDGTALKVYFHLEAFPPETYLFGKEPKLSEKQMAIWQTIKNVVETYRTGKVSDILPLWDTKRRKIFEKHLSGEEFHVVVKFWKEAKDASINVMLDAGKYCWVFLVPQYDTTDGKQEKKEKVKILTLHRVDGKYYLTDLQRFSRPPSIMGPLFTDKIIETLEFRRGLIEAMK